MRLRAAVVALVLLSPPLAGQAPAGSARAAESAKIAVLWLKLERAVADVDARLDGVLAVCIKDLTDGRVLLLHADEVMPTASTIKIAILAELFRQQSGGSGGAGLADPYVVDSADAVPGSDILAGLTPGVTRLTNRDLATLMMAVSDNGATNVLIRRVGMERVNALLDSLGLRETRLRRRMLDLEAAPAGGGGTRPGPRAGGPPRRALAREGGGRRAPRRLLPPPRQPQDGVSAAAAPRRRAPDEQARLARGGAGGCRRGARAEPAVRHRGDDHLRRRRARRGAGDCRHRAPRLAPLRAAGEVGAARESGFSEVKRQQSTVNSQQELLARGGYR